MALPVESAWPVVAPETQLIELVSGVDALYLSGRGGLSTAMQLELEAGRQEAEEAEGPVPFEFGGVEFGIEPRSMGRYRFSLVHPNAQIGVTLSEKLPTLRVQVRSEFLHAVGPRAALAWCEGVGGQALGEMSWGLSRLDLFCDVQGWDLEGDDRHRFVCQARTLVTHEDNDDLTGFQFGRRTTGTIMARLYDKTIDVSRTGKDWWLDIWGDRYDPALPVLRVEFELGRAGLGEFGIDHPTEGLDRIGGLWATLTEWLSYRIPGDDQTKSRWKVAPEWHAIQHATLRGEAIGLERIRAGKGAGSLRLITPALVGYLARFASIIGTDDLDSTLGALRWVVRTDEGRRGIQFSERIASLVRQDRFR